MIATAFDEETGVLDPPPGMTHEECDCLSVWRGLVNGLPTVISCWKPTTEEMEEIRKTGRVWLWVLGDTIPPVHLAGVSPFKQAVSESSPPG